MELKRLISHFTYRIEPKPEGGFVAHGSDPSVPPLEAPTREELQQKIQANINAALTAQFPGLNLNLENKQVKFAFHIEHNPGGGFILQSSDGKELSIVGNTHAEIEAHFAEKVAGLLGKHLMPELTQALAAQAGSGNVQVVVNRTVSFSTGPSQATSGVGAALLPGSMPAQNLGDGSNGNFGPPIAPEASNFWPVLRFVLALVIIATLIYFYRHR